MRPSLLASLLLLLSLILTEAQGARLGKGFISSDHKQHKIHDEEKGSLVKTSNGVIEDHEVVHCKDGHCSSEKNRKLMTKTTSTTATTTTASKSNANKGRIEAKPELNKRKSENEVLVGKEENFSVNSSPMSSEHGEAGHEPYPDIIDIAEMDYSPARRKPPIHN